MVPALPLWTEIFWPDGESIILGSRTGNVSGPRTEIVVKSI